MNKYKIIFNELGQEQFCTSGAFIYGNTEEIALAGSIYRKNRNMIEKIVFVGMVELQYN